MFAVAAGVFAGLIHVISGPDHLAAVAPLAADRNRRQWRAGLQWGLGHTSGVLLIGALLLGFRELIPIVLISAYSERIVGVILLCVGVWAALRARDVRRGVHSHTHAGSGASFVMGTVHGVAGSSHLFGILPALALPTQSAAVSYLAGFGIGAIAGMTAFAAVVGVVSVRAGRRGAVAYRTMLYACSLSAFIVGGFWLIR
jgi:hypothetical protein